MVNNWNKKTPKNFKFTAKFPKVITHDSSMGGTDGWWRQPGPKPKRQTGSLCEYSDQHGWTRLRRLRWIRLKNCLVIQQNHNNFPSFFS
jgi:uncharacterized protein YecE (DUF72 family)